ncbi:golgi phosphoprotein 3 [Nematocida sp. AWRm77]|nr:golgi phosphoprotein 3 [Nematocida sp. AWRm77]
MDEFTPRRRDVSSENAFSSLRRFRTPLTLPEIALIFSSTSHSGTLSILNDPLSISIRALALCELAIRDSVFVDAQKNLVAADGYRPLDEVHDEVYARIKGASKLRAVDKWLLLLNGESFSLMQDKYHVKNARKRVVMGLVEKNILKKPKSKKTDILARFIKKTAIGQDAGPLKGCKSELVQEITRFLLEEGLYAEEDRMKLHACVCALAYCILTDEVLLTLSPSSTDQAQKKISEIIGRFKTGMGDSTNRKEWSVLCILREYLKLGPWI